VASTGARARRHGRPGPGAEDPVLTSKITIPSPPGWIVPRQRIDELIAASTRGPLTLITGPPGAGKTMALTSWAAGNTEHGTLAWIALDEYDNRPQVFWAYFVATLRRAGITAPRILPAAGRGGAVGHEFLLRLASALASLAQPLVMVIEDVHLLTDADIIEGLAYVLRNAAPGLHLVMSSRIQPLLPLHRYRLNGELAEIRAKDLAFTAAESSLLMAQLGIGLSPEATEYLTERTEGWAAGIRLAAISLDGHPDPDQFVKELGAEDSAITWYLVDEVLNAQRPVVRDYLLRTSILDRVSADIAAELSDVKPAADTLLVLAAGNAFVQPLGHGWYRYHSLFADILRLKLRRESPALVPELHRRAAGWHLRNGRLTQAVRHAAAAGDWQLVARMVVEQLAIAQLIDPTGNQSLVEEFRSLPREPDAQLHLLLVAAALELSDGTSAAGPASLAAAEGILERLPAGDEIPARLAASLISSALARRTGDLGDAVAASARAETSIGRIPKSLLARRPVVRAQVLRGRGVIELWTGDVDKAAATFAGCVAAATAAGSAHERSECLGYLALVEALRGRLSRAAQLAGDAAGPQESRYEGHGELATPAARLALACVHLERNELRQADDELKLADAALGLRPDKLMGAMATLILARCRLAEGHPVLALELVSRARQSWSPPRWLERELILLESRACAAAGDVQAAVAAAGRAELQSGSDTPVALAHAWLAAGDHQAAREALACTAAAADERQQEVGLEVLLVDAQLGYASGDAVHGRRSLGRALQLAKPEQIRLPFAMARTWLRPVFRRDPDLARSYQQLLEPDLVCPVRAPSDTPAASNEPPLVVDRLSEREREVLRLLAGMLSTAEIAAEMYISVNTVKTHLKSIYRKLSAGHRGEAVRRARQLHLI
jgi:LuxR family transcriptional regulator, maltose regulon positive regulatory protein